MKRGPNRGRPQRSAPHYFVLGCSAWFAGLYTRPGEVRLSVADLPEAVTSFTYTDGITALGLGEHVGVPAADGDHRGRVYRLDQLPGVVARHGLPADARPCGPDGYSGHQQRRVEHYLEVQLWSDDPVRQHLVRD